MMAVGVSAA